MRELQLGGASCELVGYQVTTGGAVVRVEAGSDWCSAVGVSVLINYLQSGAKSLGTVDGDVIGPFPPTKLPTSQCSMDNAHWRLFCSALLITPTITLHTVVPWSPAPAKPKSMAPPRNLH